MMLKVTMLKKHMMWGAPTFKQKIWQIPGGLQPGGITLHSPPGGQTVSKLQYFNQILTMFVCVAVLINFAEK